jgi:hypothetical protein
MANEFRDFVLDNTVNGDLDSRLLNNAFLFKTLEYTTPPNRDDILDNYEFEKYPYLPLWNGKSSTFDIQVSSGTFDSTFFQFGDFKKEDFFQALRLVDEFSPAKSIPVTRVDLGHVEQLSSLDYVCPSVRYGFFDIPLSGAYAGYTASGMNMRTITGFVVNGKPVFKRADVDSTEDKAYMTGERATTDHLTDIQRTHTRRRNFEVSLPKEGFYNRTGFAMPIFFNTSSTGSAEDALDYYPLGLLPTEGRYHPVINPLDLEEVSSAPFNFNIWSNCWNLQSSKEFSGIQASDTFAVRGIEAIASATCNDYIARESNPEFITLLWDLKDSKFQRVAEKMYEINGFLQDVSGFADAIQNNKNWLWNNDESDFGEYYDEVLGKRIFSREGAIDGMHQTFKDYIDHFTSQGLGNDQISTYQEGGLNVLSHMFGPINYNGNFIVEGSGLLDTSADLFVESVATEQAFKISDLGSDLNTLSATAVTDLSPGGSELRQPYLVSGVEMCDTSGSTCKFSIFNISPDAAVSNSDNYLVDNPVIAIDADAGFPRLRFSIKDYGPANNLLIKDRKYRLDFRGLFASKNNYLLGGGAFGVWIHTDYETDHEGKEVFWNYMPNGNWEQVMVSSLSATDGRRLVRDELAHTIAMPPLYSVEARTECFAAEAEKNILFSIQEKDFVDASLEFDTRNRELKLPLRYYQAHNQLHRDDQNYIIEVFPYNTQTPDRFALIDHVRLVDTRQASRKFVKHDYTIKDYRRARTPLDADCLFVDVQGSAVPYGTTVTLNDDGTITDADGNALTFVKSESGAGVLSNNVLYKTMKGTLKQSWIKDSLGNIVELPEQEYTGPIILGSSAGDFYPERLVVEGLKKGSNVEYDVVGDLVPLSPLSILIMLREFNRLQKDVGSREVSINEDRYGTSGGSRFHYKDAPMHFHSGDYLEFRTTRNNRYKNVELYN